MLEENEMQYFWNIPSDLTLVDDVCREVRGLLTNGGLEDRVFAVDLLVREFVNNAIFYGNRSNPETHVDMTLGIGRKWIMLQVSDQGGGFNWRKLRHREADSNATRGRGLAIGARYSRKMQFNRKGNRVTLWILKNEIKETI